MSIPNLRFKSLVKKISFLKSDLEYHKEEHKTRKEVFYEAFNEFMENSDTHEYSEDKLISKMVDIYKQGKPKTTSDKDLTKTNNDELLVQNTKMYKSIARLTHPDLHKDSEKTKMFVKASVAVKSGDWYTLFELSERLGVELPEPSEEHIDWLNKEIKTIQKVINVVQETFEWKYSEPNADKERVMTIYCNLTCKKK